VRPIFFTVITISQLFGALLAFGQLDQLTKLRLIVPDREPFTTLVAAFVAAARKLSATE
jgi:hypothetical protein